MARIVWSSVARDDLKSLVSFIKAVPLAMLRPLDCTFNSGSSNYTASPNLAGRFRKIKAVRIGNSLWGTTGLSIEWTRIPSPS